MGVKGGARPNVYESHADFQLGCSHALHQPSRAGKCLTGSALTLGNTQPCYLYLYSSSHIGVLC